MTKKNKPGPKPNMEKVKRAHELRDKGLSIREIARAMSSKKKTEHPKSVQRWLNYKV